MDFDYGTAFASPTGRGVRDAAARRDARRPDELHPHGRRDRDLARRRARARRLAARRRARRTCTPPAPGARMPPTTCWRATGAAGGDRERHASTIEATLADLRAHETSGTGAACERTCSTSSSSATGARRPSEMVEVVASCRTADRRERSSRSASDDEQRRRGDAGSSARRSAASSDGRAVLLRDRRRSTGGGGGSRCRA